MANNSLPQWSDMQGLVLSSYPHLDAAEYVPLTIADPVQARRWLLGLTPAIATAGERGNVATKPFTGAFGANVRLNVNLAFSHAGLQELLTGCTATLNHFPYEFREGMAGDPHRSLALGDTGANDPAGWVWGGPAKPVHALLMVFAEDPASSQKAVAQLLDASGMKPVLGQPLEALSLQKAAGKEHFGFVDGKSQPILTGSADAERYPESIHVTDLGQFVLGYPVGPKQIVPPEPTLGGLSFGKNGSYLVARQLEQDVPRFWKFMDDWARASKGVYDPDEADKLASKFVGRRRDGTPLVPCGRYDDNEFDFSDDAHGYGCPVGAHIRRANPRGTLSNDPPKLDRASANRRRLLRRGRSYGPRLTDLRKDIGQERGLLFVALNASLEQQFEFISHNWINNRAFAGLADEVDPQLAKRGDGEARFTVPGMPARTRIKGIGDFVTMRGGEYFFLPGIQALHNLASAT